MPSSINMMLMGFCIFMATMQHNWWWVVAAAWFAWPVQWGLQLVAKLGDPQYFAIFSDALRHPPTREPD